MVKGTELSSAKVPGYLSRFMIYEVRRFNENCLPDVFFRIYDAETITSDDVRNGVRPKVVIEGRDLDAVLAKIDDLNPIREEDIHND
jgi:hypothetical protein